MAAGGHFVAGEPVLPVYQLWRTALGIIPSLLTANLWVATWYAPPCWRQSSDDDAPDFPGSGPVLRGNGASVKPYPCSLREVGVNRRHTSAPS